MRDFHDAKLMAKSLREGLVAHGLNITHSRCLELVAKQFGFADWNVLAALIDDPNTRATKLKLPKDWYVASPSEDAKSYRLGLDPATPGAALIECLFSRDQGQDLAEKFAVLMQSVHAGSYVGRRLRLTASLNTEDADLGTIWMRVDSNERRGLRFDNMIGRTSNGPLKGSTAWTERSVVLDVPNDAASIHYGFFLRGYGKVWARSFRLECVGADVAPTAFHSQYLEGTSNLDFTQAEGC